MSERGRGEDLPFDIIITILNPELNKLFVALKLKIKK